MSVTKGENSASGSDMSTVFATWSYILPSLNYIMRDPIETPDNRAPTLPIAQHASIYTVVYNFATASRTGIAGVPGFGMSGATGMRDGFDAESEANMDKFERVRAMIGYELYSLLDDYFRDLAREIRMNAPLPSSLSIAASNPSGPAVKGTGKKGKAKARSVAVQGSQPLGDELPLIAYYTKAYTRFSSGAAQINRLFAYLNRHFIMRAIDEGCGWISLSDVVAASVLKDLAAVSIASAGSGKPAKREKSLNSALPSNKKTKEDLKKLEARKHSEWRKWGYDASLPRHTEAEQKLAEQQRKVAELCVEAASSTERIVTCSALAMRSWRLEVAEPLLDPIFWNTNGRKDAWIGSPPIPPTPLTPADSKRGDNNSLQGDQDEDDDSPPTHRAISVPILLPALSNSGQGSSSGQVDQGKGKGKGKVTSAYADLALSVQVPIATTPSATPKVANGHASSGHTSPLEGEDLLNGKAVAPGMPNVTGHDQATGGTLQAPALRNKRLLSRKGVSSSAGGATTLAAVRAATAAAVAARVAAEAGEGSATTADPTIAQKGRLTRAVTYLLDAPYSQSEGEAEMVDSMSAKARYGSVIADSLMMCGMSPDKAIRRRLDRFLGKAEDEGAELIRGRW